MSRPGTSRPISTARSLKWAAMGCLTLLASCGQTPTSRVPGDVAASAGTPGVGALTVSGAAFTTTNPNQTPDAGEDRCENGQDRVTGTVNCNIYNRKEYVWINGGPTQAGPSALSDGWYFFAVLEPSGQSDPNDGGKGNLSDTDPAGGSGTTGGGDSYTNRLFYVSGGDITGYTGTHAKFDSSGTSDQGLLLQAAPFDDTSNPGGVYIMALCKIDTATYNPTDPKNNARPQDCKYDAFKVKQQTPPPPTPRASAYLSGFKYNDYDKSGGRGLGEPGIDQWQIKLDCTGYKSVQTILTTSSQGFWEYDFGTYDQNDQPTTCDVEEVQQTPQWRQTGNIDKDPSMLEDGAFAALDNFKYEVRIDSTKDATVTQLNFGNIPQGTVSGAKYYDGDENGKRNGNEFISGGISGWQISRSGTTEPIKTTGDGSFAVTLDPGTYTFTEKSGGARWKQTGNTVNQSASTNATVSLLGKSYTVEISRDQPSTVSGLNFGNVCELSLNGRTMGFWSNTNGQALIAGANISQLRLYNLRNANGSDFDPADKTAYRKWLLSASATNMAYMLSAQMSASYLSLQYFLTAADRAVIVDRVNGLTTAQLLPYADALLAKPIASGAFATQNGGSTVATSALRTEQERVKNIFDKINNNGALGGFVQPTQDTCPPPTF